ncbi:TonB-dependent receptor [Bacteroides caecigallinarum]|uniref:TonB-dependent receptor n=1 Tax=Bacteroides caecigallinarum TaxID=1411144 RepID=UPI001F2B1522|nr:TonB-dependent receptor [Bacteroides caecigallinarum]MCF2594539.1 TonB-dependent receptor [Bacteroides caecigallinarum]
MRRRTVLKTFKFMAAGVTIATGVTPAYSLPTNENISAPADTTRVIDIEEVVVIATPKENNRLRQQPISATSFSQGDMRNNSVTSVKSLSGLVPNLFIPDYGSKLTTSVYVRGIGSRINTPAVGLYVDNIPFIDKSAFDFNYSDIERIDVLRGPQGTLYGRNTMGGLIRVFTKSPFTYQGTDISLGAATYNNYKASVNHYHRISDKFAFSAGAFYEHEGGFFENVARDNEKIDKGDEVGGRMRAIWLPKDNLKLDFTVNYEYSNQGGYPYQLTSLSETDIYYQDLKGDLGKVAYNNECGYMRHLLNGGLNLEHQAENFILSSVTGFQYLKDEMNLDQDFTRKNVYTMAQRQNSKTISEEIVLKSKPGRRWQWTTGVSGFYQWLDTEGPVTFHEDGISSLMENNVNGIFKKIKEEKPMMPDMSLDITDNNILIGGNFKSPMLSTGIYHQSTINDIIFDGLSFTAGLRMEYEKYWLDYNSNTNINFDFKIAVMPMPFKGLNSSPKVNGNISHDYIQLLPKFALQYDFNKNNNIYASVTKGYRSGGYNIQMFSEIVQGEMINGMISVLDEKSHGMVSQMGGDKIPHYDFNIQETTLYKPEYSWNYEIGSRMTMFDGRLQADVAAFYMDTHDQQISRFAASGLGRVTVNAGKSRSIGGELALKAQITDVFSLNGNYGYTHATFTDYVVSDEVNYNGNYVPFVPEHTFTVGGQYIFRMKSGAWLDNIIVNANYKGAGRIYWTEQNNAYQDLYGTLNGRISLNKGNGQIGIWINNALNTDYQAFYFESMNRGFAQMGRPMQIGVDLRCRF